jgi:hypothetical protein
MTSSDFSDCVALHFTLRLIAGLTVAVDYRPPEISLVSASAVITFRSPYAVESIEVAIQNLPLFYSLHQKVSGSALPVPYADAAGFPLWYGLPSCTSFSEAHSAFTPQSPEGMRSLLRGSLAITTTGLPPASEYRLSRHTIFITAR